MGVARVWWEWSFWLSLLLVLVTRRYRHVLSRRGKEEKGEKERRKKEKGEREEKRADIVMR